jgi:hypothetical protein
MRHQFTTIHIEDAYVDIFDNRHADVSLNEIEEED